MYKAVNSKNFINQTKKGLENFPTNKLACRGFEIDQKDNGGSCILVMGLNPAGRDDEKGGNPAAEREKNNANIPYFYSIPDLGDDLNGWHYPTYYKPIFDFAENIFGHGNVNWNWCNLNESVIEELFTKDKYKKALGIDNYKERKYKDIQKKVKDFFLEHKDLSQTTIYIGDMFYYHETSSKDLPKKQNFCTEEWKNYYKTMLKYHIEELLKHDKEIKFVYFNNAKVSHGYLGDEGTQPYKTIDKIEIEGQNIPIFFGSMLSGQHMMDSYSKQRLVEEIRKELKIK